MCQRVVIALALACKPQLLIADEPTTGLDVTTQKAVMDLIVELTQRRGMSTILITHDLGLAAAYCDRVVVMEKGAWSRPRCRTTFSPDPEHAYTGKLMRATPRPGRVLARPAARAGGDRRKPGCLRSAPPMLRRGARPRAGGDKREAAAGGRKAGQGISAQGPRRRCWANCSRRSRRPEPEQFRAVDGISFTVDRGESVGLVGESGCGKSTTSTMVMRLIDQTDGRSCSTARISAPSRQGVRPAADAQAHPDGVPGPDRQPQPSLHGCACDR